MAEWLSTFVAGFEPLVEALAGEMLPGAADVRVSGGLATYALRGDPSGAPLAALFTHTFAVLRRYGGEDFPAMVRAAAGADFRAFTRPGQSFRVRFHDRGRFAAVDGAVARAAEAHILRMARLRVDRVNPDLEFWYIRRADNAGYYALLRPGRTGREPAKGALQPELAAGMCLLAGLRDGDAMADPFAGSGAIVERALAIARLRAAHASDLDEAAARRLEDRLGSRASVARCDARSLTHLAGASLDAIVTDPPWGLYRAQSPAALADLYAEALAEFRRVLRPGGRLVLLTAAERETDRAAKDAGFFIRRKLPILVHGKKATLYRME
ncbi:MAG: hypothetical protein GX558_00605 [Clostridiales bacterium]|nr:hypothetical protein [Clostridiales bacterium]